MRKWHPSWLIWMSLVVHLSALATLFVAFHTWPWIVSLVLANHLVLTLVGMWPRSRALGPNWTRLPEAAVARNEIALTIDDGPDPRVTPKVLTLLDQHGIRATFFCIGEKAARYPDLCRDIVRRGHTVENHTQHHSHYFGFMGVDGFRRELQAAQHTLTAVTGEPPQFFRAPAGIRNPFLEPVLAQMGLQLASWTARGFDTRHRDATQVKARLLKQLRPGTILLLHDGNAARTAEGVPVIVEVLPALFEAAHRARLRFVSLREARA